MVHLDWKPLPDRARLGRQHAQAGVDACCGSMQCRIEDNIAAPHGVLADLRPAENERTSLPRLALFDRSVLRVDRAHARLQARWADQDVVVDADRAGHDRPSHSRAKTRKRKRAVDGQTEPTVLWPQRGHGCRSIQTGRQIGKAIARDCRDRHDRAALEARAHQHRLDIAPHSRQPILGDEVALVEGDEAALEPEQVHDREMLARLRHDPVVGCNDQDDEVDAGGAGQHVVHEALVARHIDEADDLAARARPVGKAEVDGDAARLLLLEPVGIHAGQLAHQRGLAVIDVAGGADDHGAASFPSRRAGSCASCARKPSSSSRQRRSRTSAPSLMWPMTGIGRLRKAAASASNRRAGALALDGPQADAGARQRLQRQGARADLACAIRHRHSIARAGRRRDGRDEAGGDDSKLGPRPREVAQRRQRLRPAGPGRGRA